MSPVAPGVQAEIDQDKARLRDLVADARQHQARGCCDPDNCPGQSVAVRLVAMPRRKRDELLMMAISQLARLTGNPGVDDEPAEDAVVRVDTPDGPAYYLRDDTLDQCGDCDHWWPLVTAAIPLSWAEVSADGPPVVLAPSTPEPEKGLTTP